MENVKQQDAYLDGVKEKVFKYMAGLLDEMPENADKYYSLLAYGCLDASFRFICALNDVIQDLNGKEHTDETIVLQAKELVQVYLDGVHAKK